jgi:hypothetical protein
MIQEMHIYLILAESLKGRYHLEDRQRQDDNSNMGFRKTVSERELD